MNVITMWGPERIVTRDPDTGSNPATPYVDQLRFGTFIPQIASFAFTPAPADDRYVGFPMLQWTHTVTSTGFNAQTDSSLQLLWVDPVTGQLAVGASPGTLGDDGISLQFSQILEVDAVPGFVGWIGFGNSIDILQGQYTLQLGSTNPDAAYLAITLGTGAATLSDLSLVALDAGDSGARAVVFTRSPSGYLGGNVSDGAAGDGAGVYAVIYGDLVNGSGTPTYQVLAPEFRVNTATAGEQTGSDAVSLGSTFLVIWNERGESIRGKILDASGATAQADTDFVLAPIAGDPVVARLNDGNVALAWTQAGEVCAQVFTTAGAAVGEATRINDHTLNNQELPKIVASRDGGFVVIFNDSSFTPPDTGDAALLAQKFDAAGVRVGENVLVPTTLAGNHIEHDIVTLSDGRMAVTWSDSDGVTTRLQFLDDRGGLIYGTDKLAPDHIYGADAGSPYADNVIVLGAGDDVAYGYGGNDYVYGGAGIDLAHGGAGVDVLLGEAGDDQLFGEGDTDYVYGGDGNDAMNGGNGVDVLIGEAGNDAFYGGAGDDYVYAGDGDDTAFGDDGNDIFVMEAGNDAAAGGAGQDYFYMGEGSDTLDGGDGVDVLLGEDGNDVFFGGAGVDYLFLGPGGAGDNDTVFVDGTQSGPQVVYDFEAGGSNDAIRFANTSFHSFADVQAAMTDYTAAGGFMVITVDSDTNIWLIGLQPTQLTAGDFLFA